MKKFIFLLGKKEEQSIEVAKMLSDLGAVNSCLSYSDGYKAPLLEAMRWKNDYLLENKKQNLVLKAHHVRHFLSKLGAGSFAVGRYDGMEFDSPLELVQYFQKKVIPNTVGNRWVMQQLIQKMQLAPNGVHLVHDINPVIASELKDLVLGGYIVQVVESKDEKTDTFPVDFYIKFDKDDLEKNILSFLKKMKKEINKESINDQVT